LPKAASHLRRQLQQRIGNGVCSKPILFRCLKK
jgi:hypothetical protein